MKHNTSRTTYKVTTINKPVCTCHIGPISFAPHTTNEAAMPPIPEMQHLAPDDYTKKCTKNAEKRERRIASERPLNALCLDVPDKFGEKKKDGKAKVEKQHQHFLDELNTWRGKPWKLSNVCQ